MPRKADTHLPDGMHSVTVYLWFNGNCKDAIDFYKRVFGAVQAAPALTSPDGQTVMHGVLKIGDSEIMMADAFPDAWEQGPQSSATAGLWVYFEDCDTVIRQATESGCELLMPVQDAFWGDRFGKVKDPFGHCWGIATQKWVLTSQEMEEHQKEWLRMLEQH